MVIQSLPYHGIRNLSLISGCILHMCLQYHPWVFLSPSEHSDTQPTGQLREFAQQGSIRHYSSVGNLWQTTQQSTQYPGAILSSPEATAQEQ